MLVSLLEVELGLEKDMGSDQLLALELVNESVYELAQVWDHE